MTEIENYIEITKREAALLKAIETLGARVAALEMELNLKALKIKEYELRLSKEGK